jgi:glycosyltransferase involved in cell wall biosynthesis
VEINTNAIIHTNSAHSVAGLLDYKNRMIVQINDYDSAIIYQNILPVFFKSGLRRVVSLIWRNSQEQKVLSSVKRVVCNSHYTRKDILKSYKIDEKRCLVIHKAVNILAFTRPDNVSLKDKPKSITGMRFIFVGSNWARKGLDVLINALAIVILKYPDVQLTVVGNPNNKIIKYYSDLASQVGVRDNINFAGHKNRQDLAILLWQSDCFILPSRQEALGIAILEAMAAGLPVIATKVGGIPEIIVDEAHGLLVDSDNPAELSDAMLRLIEDYSKRVALAAQSSMSVERFSVDVMVDKVLQLYENFDA